jgi:hypothetical protein
MAKRVEEPTYEVVRRIGEVEIRAYEPTVVAVTDVEGPFDRVQNEGFRRLAGYIFGGNRQRQSIAMTAPVTTAPMKITATGFAHVGDLSTRSSAGADEIAMTAPVSTTAITDQTHQVSFTMPAGMTVEALPEPLDGRVRLMAVPRRLVAVLGFSGFSGEERFKTEQAALLTTLGRAGLATHGSPSLARYDPPWTLPFFRRNELLVELAASPAP